MVMLSSVVSSCSSTSTNSQSLSGSTIGGSKMSNKQHRRNRKTHVYVSGKANSNTTTTNNNNYDHELKQEEQLSMTMTPADLQTQYKWTHCISQGIQLAFEFFAKLVLTTVSFFWNLTSPTIFNNFSFFSENSFFKAIWNYILATMTIEIVTSTETIPPTNTMDSTTTTTTVSSCLPVLRLNSEILDEFDEYHHSIGRKLSEDDSEDRIDHGIESGSDLIHSNSSNYNSSDGEQDTIVFTDDENNTDKTLAASLASTLEFLEKQQQQYPSRRDSDSSFDGSSDKLNENEISKSQVNGKQADEAESRIIRQVEILFSDNHLEKDGFLLKHVRRRSDGFVSLKLVAGLRKVKQVSRDFNVVVSALRKSSKVEVNADGTKIRRVEPLTAVLKSLPVANGNPKDKENNKSGKDGQKSKNSSRNSSMEQQPLSDNELSKCMRVNGQITNNNNTSANYQRRSQRFSNTSTTSGSSVSPASSACSSRHGSFSCQPGGDLFNRNNYVSPAEESLEQALLRRRGGSLPINAHQKRHSHSSYANSYLSPSSSPPNSTSGQNRPKSNSYCEGTNITNGSPNTGGMSLWLQKRLASSRASDGNISVAATVIRQPRGPDGSKGFAAGYRQMILEDKQVRERKMGQQMI